MLSNMRVSAYIAHAMTGRPGADLIEESAWAKKILESKGVLCLDPVTVEEVADSRKKINTPYPVLDGYWKRDKEMIREANVVVDLTPDRKSEGVSHELGYARYGLWKPIIRVYPTGKTPSNLSAAYFEDDFITDSLESAAEYIIRDHGTLFKRITWRLKLYQRCILKACWYKIREWK